MCCQNMLGRIFKKYKLSVVILGNFFRFSTDKTCEPNTLQTLIKPMPVIVASPLIKSSNCSNCKKGEKKPRFMLALFEGLFSERV